MFSSWQPRGWVEKAVRGKAPGGGLCRAIEAQGSMGVGSVDEKDPVVSVGLRRK